ncbi:MAG TPA: CoA transferase, partial [Acidimicrobiales bacterium]|nr:CoA transferase [Acidimicrobiales bacterium]
MGALDGLRVLELGGDISAAYATKLLADLGADVVKMEPPDGDPLRRSNGPLFRHLNAGKRSVALVQTAGLLAVADLLIENLGPGGLEGVTPDAVDRVSTVRISDFGQEGPYRDLPATEFVVQAMAGWVSAHGLPGRDPVQVGGRIPQYVAGSFAACAGLSAVGIATARGAPVTVDLSLMECLVGTLAYPMLFQLTLDALGLPPPEQRYSVLPGIVRCRDGWAGINALTGQHWQDICAMLGADEWSGKQRDLGWGGVELERFFAHVQPVLDGLGVEELVELGQAFRIPAAPVGDGESLPRFAQFRAREFFVHEAEGPAVVPGPPWRLSTTPAEGPRPAPRLGGDQVEWSGRAAPPTAPLDGLRIIDLGTFWAAPYATLYLGALGADVIKIESVQRPDGFRFSAAFPQEGADWYERSGLWQATNLNKRDVTLDLTQTAGRDGLRGLIEGADVLIENFSPRVVDGFGFTYDEIRALNPSIVMVRMPGFGLEGPWRDY